MNDVTFTGGDGLQEGTMQYYMHRALMVNELNGGRGAYKISNAGAAASGPSFGPLQYDIGSNTTARQLLESICRNGRDANGNRLVSDDEINSIRSHLYKPFNQLNTADSEAYHHLRPKLDLALKTAWAKEAINRDYVAHLDKEVTELNAHIDQIENRENREFLRSNSFAKLIVMDTRNQYGGAVNRGFEHFLGMSEIDLEMQMPGREQAENIGVHGAFGLEEMVRYKLETQYGQTDKGARDVLRRVSNIVNAVGVYDISLSQEDQVFFRTGLRQYLVDNGRDASILDTAALQSLHKLGQITEAERTVAHIQKNLNALGIPEIQGQRLVVDGNLGGLNSHTNEAIAVFKQQNGLTGPLSNAELLMATHVALRVKQSLDFDHPVRDGLPGPTPTPQMSHGMPDYLNNTQWRMPMPDQPSTNQGPDLERRQPMQSPSAEPTMHGPGRHVPHGHRDFEPEQPLYRPQHEALTFPIHHRDYALFEAIRRQLPPDISDEMAAHVMLEAKIGGVVHAGKLDEVIVQDGTAFVAGKTPGDMAFVDLSGPVPSLQETLQRSAAWDQQQAMQLSQFQEQQREINARGAGPTMEPPGGGFGMG